MVEITGSLETARFTLQFSDTVSAFSFDFQRFTGFPSDEYYAEI